jgi:uncharacterized circularly permuted ATP-grasp superfamily protein
MTTDIDLLSDAIDYYHSLLANSQPLSSASVEGLQEGMKAGKIFFAGRQLCNVLRPHFFTRAQADYVSAECAKVLAAIEKLGAVMTGSDQAEAERLLNDVGLTKRERELFQIDNGYTRLSAHSRLDSFFSHDGTLHFVEYNAESPAGATYEDGLQEVFGQMPVMQEFAKMYELTHVPVKARLLKMLLDRYQEYCEHFGKPHKTPNIAIIDWLGVATVTEFQLLQEHFQAQQVPTVICDPHELVFENGRLRYQDFEIDLVLKRALSSELIEKEAEIPALFAAYEAGVFCMVNNFRCKPFHKKAIFALLTDERNQVYFSQEERAALAAHIPWTRVVQVGPTTYKDQTIDLHAFVTLNRERLVLKPNDEYGGKGVVIGWESSETEWEQAFQAALNEPFVVQEKVLVAKEVFPVVQDGYIKFAERSVDCDPYIFDSQAYGTLTRLAATALLNVTAGGGSTVPTFIIEGKIEGSVKRAVDSEGCV